MKRRTRKDSTGTLGAGSRSPASARGCVLIVGPDGAGKSTVADLLVEAARNDGIPVVHAHWRPGVLLKRDGTGAVSEPHAQEPRGLVTSLAKLVLVAADFALGWLGPWRRARKNGLLIIERGWWDQLVDPRRYRIPTRVIPLIRAVGVLMPRADAVVVLGGAADAIARRKPELTPEEIDRQQRAWRRVASRAGRTVLDIDAVSASPEQTEAAVSAGLRGLLDDHDTGWQRAPLAPMRLDLRTAGGAGAKPALSIYRTSKPWAHAAAAANRALVANGFGRSTQSPVTDLRGLAQRIGVDFDGAAAFRSAPPQRWVLGLSRAGDLHTVVKVGPLDDPALVREHDMLARLSGLDGPFRVPELRWAGEWNGRFLVATGAVRSGRRTTRIEIDDVVDVAVALTCGIRGCGPLIHGDFTSWNFLGGPDALTLLDWESSRDDYQPMFDLVHFVVAGSMLRRFDPARALEHLVADSHVGQRYCARIGLDADAAKAFLLDALKIEAQRSTFAGAMLDRLA